MPDDDKASVKDQMVEKLKKLKPVASTPSPVIWALIPTWSKSHSEDFVGIVFASWRILPAILNC
jgi:hypothetical protein